MDKIKTIIFDLGGVILDLDWNSVIEAFGKLGFREAADLLNPYRQKGIFLNLEKGIVSPEELYGYIREKTGRDLSGEDINKALNKFISGLSPYKLEMLENLRKRFELFVLSNTNAIMFPDLDKTWFGQQGKGIADYFDRLFLSYEMKMLKPDDEIFEKVISETGIIPGETLYIDDSQANVDAGRKFGFNVYKPAPMEDFRHIFEIL